jgi:hypothetical protein
LTIFRPVQSASLLGSCRGRSTWNCRTGISEPEIPQARATDFLPYADLMVRGFAHVRQYDLFGPYSLGAGYGINEVIAGFAGWDPGCGNVFERGAGLGKGGYGC